MTAALHTRDSMARGQCRTAEASVAGTQCETMTRGRAYDGHFSAGPHTLATPSSALGLEGDIASGPFALPRPSDSNRFNYWREFTYIHIQKIVGKNIYILICIRIFIYIHIIYVGSFT